MRSRACVEACCMSSAASRSCSDLPPETLELGFLGSVVPGDSGNARAGSAPGPASRMVSRACSRSELRLRSAEAGVGSSVLSSGTALAAGACVGAASDADTRPALAGVADAAGAPHCASHASRRPNLQVGLGRKKSTLIPLGRQPAPRRRERSAHCCSSCAVLSAKVRRGARASKALRYERLIHVCAEHCGVRGTQCVTTSADA